MNENKTNTLLLTVIGVATLLVAVIGATFAYFTATINGNEETTTINATAGILTINYDGGTPVLHPASETISPQVTSTELPYGTPIITKTFTVKGNNSTSSVMPYTLALVVDENTFSSNALKITLDGTLSGNGVIAPNITDTDNAGIPTNPTSASGISIDFCNATPCKFVGKATNDIHTYTLKVFFPNTETNQDSEKGKTFKGHVAIGVEPAYTTVTTTAAE